MKIPGRRASVRNIIGDGAGELDGRQLPAGGGRNNTFCALGSSTHTAIARPLSAGAIIRSAGCGSMQHAPSRWLRDEKTMRLHLRVALCTGVWEFLRPLNIELLALYRKLELVAQASLGTRDQSGRAGGWIGDHLIIPRTGRRPPGMLDFTINNVLQPGKACC